MPFRNLSFVQGARVLTALLAAFVAVFPGKVGAQPKTRNVVLIVTDGLRWQELFRGGERALITKRPGGARDTARSAVLIVAAEVDA